MPNFDVAAPGSKKSGIASILVNGNTLDVLDSRRESVAKVVTQHVGKSASLTLTGADGHVSNIAFDAASDASKTITITGTYNGDPFHWSIAADGTLSDVLRPKNLNPMDTKIGIAILHLEFPEPRPIEHHAKVGQIAKPLISVGCGLAIIGSAVAGWEAGPLSISFAIHALVLECLL